MNRTAITTTDNNTSFKFISLMALLMSMVALGIDSMLPALKAIGEDLNVTNPNDNQLIISFMFIGLSVGQLVYGPLSDTVGRKKTVYLGFLVFSIGCLFSINADNLEIMLIGRVLQGFGLSASRVVCVAIIRDQYVGNEMARIMSFIMTIFILVPTIAPLIGQEILHYGSWVTIFYFLFIVGLISITWFTFQQKETLAIEDRIPFTFKNIKTALIKIFSNKIALGYTIITGLLSGSFLGFLNTSQQVLEFQYELGDKFPIYFAIVALTFGVAAFVNGKLVQRFDMHQITWISLIVVFAFSSISSIIQLFFIPYLSLNQYFGFLLPNLFFVGLLFGNINSIAMEPLGKIAGIGAAVIGSLSTFLMVIIGVTIGYFYVDNTLPVILGFGICSTLSLIIAYFVRK